MLKDEVILNLGGKGNVAQFVSFDPDKNERFHLIHGIDEAKFADYKTAIKTVFDSSPAGTVNIRTFRPEDSQTPEFIFGIASVDEAIEKMEELAAKGLHTIVHETIPLDDGGVSGIVQNGIVEFAPGVTPRFVENASDKCAQMTLRLALGVFKRVYNFVPNIDVPDDVRLEFSIHPQKCGYAKDNTIVWEYEKLSDDRRVDPKEVLEHGVNSWPHSFSKHIGDKAYGLVIADSLGFDVPYTSVFVRSGKLGIIGFGVSKSTPTELWTRTCPAVQEPGLFSTIKNCVLSPDQLMDKDDPEGDRIASCLIQDGIKSVYSGSTITSADGEPIIEGVKGYGDDFMTGDADAEVLPDDIVDVVTEKYNDLKEVLGDVRFEWAVDDANTVWVLQLHMGATESSSTVIYPGEFVDGLSFVPSDGLPVLRDLIKDVKPNQGVLVKGYVGITSHVADVLRKAKVPSRIEA